MVPVTLVVAGFNPEPVVWIDAPLVTFFPFAVEFLDLECLFDWPREEHNLVIFFSPKMRGESDDSIRSHLTAFG